MKEVEMSLRDYFAGQALAGNLARDVVTEDDPSWYWNSDRHDALAFDCYRIADAMLKAREK